jgi:hypothetical protein
MSAACSGRGALLETVDPVSAFVALGENVSTASKKWETIKGRTVLPIAEVRDLAEDIVKIRKTAQFVLDNQGSLLGLGIPGDTITVQMTLVDSLVYDVTNSSELKGVVWRQLEIIKALSNICFAMKQNLMMLQAYCPSEDRDAHKTYSLSYHAFESQVQSLRHNLSNLKPVVEGIGNPAQTGLLAKMEETCEGDFVSFMVDNSTTALSQDELAEPAAYNSTLAASGSGSA